MMIASNPRDPRPNTTNQVQWTVVDAAMRVAIGMDDRGDAIIWSIGSPDAPCGCACPNCAPYEQVDE